MIRFKVASKLFKTLEAAWNYAAPLGLQVEIVKSEPYPED